MARSHTESYAAILFPDTTKVCGVRLKPVTIGHALLLYRLKSPFIMAAKFQPVIDLANGVYVLSRRWDRAARGIRRGSPALSLIGLRIIWKTRKSPERTFAELAIRNLVSEHVNQSFEDPPISPHEDDEMDSDKVRHVFSPMLLRLKTALMEQLGCSEAEALNYPVRRAAWDLAAKAEAKGEMEWTDPKDADAVEDLLNHIQQKEATNAGQ